MKGVAREGLYELLCLPTHLSSVDVLYASSISELINCISNPVYAVL